MSGARPTLPALSLRASYSPNPNPNPQASGSEKGAQEATPGAKELLERLRASAEHDSPASANPKGKEKKDQVRERVQASTPRHP